MKTKRKQYLVLGMGRFGTSVAKSLSEMGHEVLAIDSDADAVEAIAPFVTQALQADATDEAVLESVGAGGFDAAVVSIGSNVRDSILISMLCKEAGIPLVMAKATDDLHAKILTRVGVDRVIFPERDMGQRLARSLTGSNIVDIMELTDDYQIAEVIAPEAWAGKTLVQINVRRNYGLSVIAIRRGEQLLPSPGADASVHSGDVLLVLGKEQDIDELNGR